MASSAGQGGGEQPFAVPGVDNEASLSLGLELGLVPSDAARQGARASSRGIPPRAGPAARGLVPRLPLESLPPAFESLERNDRATDGHRPQSARRPHRPRTGASAPSSARTLLHNTDRPGATVAYRPQPPGVGRLAGASAGAHRALQRHAIKGGAAGAAAPVSSSSTSARAAAATAAAAAAGLSTARGSSARGVPRPAAPPAQPAAMATRGATPAAPPVSGAAGGARRTLRVPTTKGGRRAVPAAFAKLAARTAAAGAGAAALGPPPASSRTASSSESARQESKAAERYAGARVIVASCAQAEAEAEAEAAAEAAAITMHQVTPAEWFSRRLVRATDAHRRRCQEHGWAFDEAAAVAAVAAALGESVRVDPRAALRPAPLVMDSGAEAVVAEDERLEALARRKAVAAARAEGRPFDPSRVHRPPPWPF